DGRRRRGGQAARRDLESVRLVSTRTRVAVAVAAALVLGSSALAAPRVGGRAYLVVSSNGDVLLQRAADERVSIASITKLMTVLRRRVAHLTGRTLHTWNDLLATFPGLIGVKTGHTGDAGWGEVAAAQGRGVTIYATLLGEPSRTARNSDLAELLAWGLAQYRV